MSKGKEGGRPGTVRRNDSVQAPLETYLREVNEFPLLSAQKEREIAARVRQGDKTARDQLVRANLRLVVNVARSYAGKGLSLQDLIEEGNVGLLRAVEGFNPDMETRFSTYASYWIKQSIKHALVDASPSIRIPAYMVELMTKWRRASAKLQENLGRTPSQEEIAQELNLPKKKLEIIKKAIRVYNSAPPLDQPEEGSLDDLLLETHAPAPGAEIADADDLQHVLDLLGKLSPLEASVLRLRFGLDNEEPKTLKEIGEKLGMTRERVRQIEAEALHKLHEGLEAD